MNMPLILSRPSLLQPRCWIVLSTLLTYWVVGPLARAQGSDAEQERAIAAIEGLRGKVERDEKRPNRPVTGIDLRRCDIADADLAHLKGLTDLQKLYLTSTPITDAGLAHLEGLTRLRKLSLGFTPTTDAGLLHVVGLTHLRVQGYRTIHAGIPCKTCNR